MKKFLLSPKMIVKNFKNTVKTEVALRCLSSRIPHQAKVATSHSKRGETRTKQSIRPHSSQFESIKSSLRKTIWECHHQKINSNYSNQRIKTKRAAKRIIIWLQSLTAARVRIQLPQDPLRTKSRVEKRTRLHSRSQMNTRRVTHQLRGRRTLKSLQTKARRLRVLQKLKARSYSCSLNLTKSKRHNLSQLLTTCNK